MVYGGSGGAEATVDISCDANAFDDNITTRLSGVLAEAAETVQNIKGLGAQEGGGERGTEGAWEGKRPFELVYVQMSSLVVAG